MLLVKVRVSQKQPIFEPVMLWLSFILFSLSIYIVFGFLDCLNFTYATPFLVHSHFHVKIVTMRTLRFLIVLPFAQ